MQALTLSCLDIGLVGFLVVPRLVGLAPFHRRENVDQTRMIAPLGYDVFDTVCLPKRILLGDELDRYAMLLSYGLSIVPNQIT